MHSDFDKPLKYLPPVDCYRICPDGSAVIHQIYIDGTWYSFGWCPEGKFAVLRYIKPLDGGWQESQPWEPI